MRVLWASDAWAQYIRWQQADSDTVKKINDLIEATRLVVTTHQRRA
jgi:Txe/YoeB family toxin of Txe-Axe toxin-antitoxin module